MFLLEALLLLWMLLLLIMLSLPVSSLVYVFELLTFKGLNLFEIEHLLLEKFKLAVAALAVSEKLLGSAYDSKTIDTVPLSFCLRFEVLKTVGKLYFLDCLLVCS
jgi:hypothetical protein